jgi:uncharacterized membrane protein YdbT with pleckstrin-like domain
MLNPILPRARRARRLGACWMRLIALRASSSLRKNTARPAAAIAVCQAAASFAAAMRRHLRSGIVNVCDSASRSKYTWVPLVIALVVLLTAFIKRQSSDFAVTNKRVMMKAGVFSTRSIELLLNKIEAIAVNQSVVGRTFGYGDIVVTGSGGTREAFSHIQGPLAFRRAVQSVTDTQSNPAQSSSSLSG